MVVSSMKRYGTAMDWWKVVGLAGLAGVAATGVKVARDERQRKAYSPDEVRSRLHERANQPLDAEPESQTPESGERESVTVESVDQESVGQGS
jgi:hypothetical protein